MRITARLAWEEIEGGDEMQLVLKEIVEPGWYGESIQEAYQKSLEEQEAAATKSLQTIEALDTE